MGREPQDRRASVLPFGFLTVIALALLFATAAFAHSYPMYQCRDDSGGYASVRADWRLTASPGGQLYNVCASRGTFGIRQTPSGQTGQGGGSFIKLLVPVTSPHVSFDRVAFKLLVAPKTGDAALSFGWVTVWSGPQELETQVLPGGTTTWIDRLGSPLGGSAPAGARSVTLGVTCHASCQFNPSESLQIREAVFSLNERVPPVVGGVGGSLFESGPRQGVQTLTFDAADADSGVRATTVLVDGAAVAVDDLSGECHYDDFAPCPTAAPNRFLVLDTRRLAPGLHRLVLKSDDAAGNVVFKDSGSFAVAIGATARVSRTARLRARYAVTLRPTRTLRWGQRFRTQGRLTALDGHALSHVPISATAPAGHRKVARTIGRVTTRRNGSWSMLLDARFPSGRIIFAYADGRGGGASSQLTAKVRAGIRLTVRRHVVAPFGRIDLSGRLLGGPVPRRGKVIELRARGRHDKHWITFRTVRTDRRGRFSASHRLKQGYHDITYEFEAVSRYEAGYRYETGVSNVERVSVR